MLAFVVSISGGTQFAFSATMTFCPTARGAPLCGCSGLRAITAAVLHGPERKYAVTLCSAVFRGASTQAASGTREGEVQVTGDPDHPSAPCPNSRFGALAAEGLRLGTGEDLAEIARMALDSLVPGFADAAVGYVAEHLCPDGVPARGNPGGQDAPGLTVRRVASRSASNDHGLTGFPPG